MNCLEIDGILPINKEVGMTSHDVVAKLRRILGIKKIGHTGTLDPDVTGVLPICIGRATRLSEYIMEMPKTYKGQFIIGIATKTQDFTGEIIEKLDVINLTEEELYMTAKNFIGDIEQIPPMYSSVKVNGKRLYEIAREGKEIERKSRKVKIYSIDINKIYMDDKNPKVDFIVKCSKGTYIRTLCVDIGKKLGYPAHMTQLERIESGSFKVENSYTINEIENYFNSNRINEILVSMNDSLPAYKEVVLSENDIKEKIYNGQEINLHNIESYNGIIKILNKNKDLAALYKTDNNNKNAKPIKVFKY